MLCKSSTKGSRYASFFSFQLFIFVVITSQAAAFGSDDDHEHIAALPQWHALLHYQGGKPHIVSEKFLLSGTNFSPVAELRATLRLFEENPYQYCRFPARANFLYQQGVVKKTPDFSICQGYSEFLSKAPADSLSLVYSSENLFSASSMMGHILLKTEGLTEKGLQVEHGVSFFTEIDSYNLPKIMYDSLVTGKQGYFQITPYKEKLDFYLYDENRNVWEYKLKLTSQQLDLIQAHFWELGEADLPYFFHIYNCATVTQLVLTIAYPELSDSIKGWLSPLDVVKNVDALGGIESTKVIPPADWRMRMLQDTLPREVNTQIKQTVENNEALELPNNDLSSAFAAYQLALTYNQYLAQSGARTADDAATFESRANAAAPHDFNSLYLDIADYKSPLKTPEDAQLAVGVSNEFDFNWVFFEYLPAGRTIEDDNRQFFAENELGLSSFRLALEAEKQELRLDYWQIYQMRSIIPYDRFTGGLSSQFRLGFEQHRDQSLEPDTAFNAAIGTGYATTIRGNSRAFAGINVGLGYSTGDAYLYFYPEVGLFLYDLKNMKSSLIAQRYYNLRGENLETDSFVWKQSFFFRKNMSLVAEYQRFVSKIESENLVSFKFKYFF